MEEKKKGSEKNWWKVITWKFAQFANNSKYIRKKKFMVLWFIYTNTQPGGSRIGFCFSSNTYKYSARGPMKSHHHEITSIMDERVRDSIKKKVSTLINIERKILQMKTDKIIFISCLNMGEFIISPRMRFTDCEEVFIQHVHRFQLWHNIHT